MKHILKVDRKYWPALCDGRKTFEIRFNDRDFQAEDTLEMYPIDPAAPEVPLGPLATWRITYVATFPAGLRDGYVVLGISEMETLS